MNSRARAIFAPLSVAAYRRLWASEVASGFGDWAARLALSVLVLQRTGSATLMALVVAASLVPWLGPGQLLATAGDRLGRRTVMVASDIVRGLCFLVMLLPLPVAMLLLLAFIAGLATPPFAAARAASIPNLVPKDALGEAIALGQMTQDASVILGYLAGGAVVALVGASTALFVNAMSFFVSALLLTGLPSLETNGTAGVRADLRRSALLLKDDRLIRRCVSLVMAASFSYAAIESLAVVYAERDGGGHQWIAGVALAVSALVSLVVTSLVPTQGTDRLVRWTAGLTCVGGLATIAGFTLAGDGAAAIPAFAVAGVLLVVIVPANVLVAPRLPDEVRASALSLLMGSLVASQAIGAALAGLFADATSPVTAAVILALPAAVIGGRAVASPIADGVAPRLAAAEVA